MMIISKKFLVVFVTEKKNDGNPGYTNVVTKNKAVAQKKCIRNSLHSKHPFGCVRNRKQMTETLVTQT